MTALTFTETVRGRREYAVKPVLLIVSVAVKETVLSWSPGGVGGGPLVTILAQEVDQRCTSPAVAAIYAMVGETQLASIMNDVMARETLSVSVPTETVQALSE